MRRLISSVALVGLMLVSPRWCDAQEIAAPDGGAAATTTSTIPATTFETEIQGKAQLGPGRWLLLVDLDLSGRRRTIASFWETTQGPDGLELTEFFVDPPAGVKQRLEAVTGTGVIWTPTEADLAEIDASWKQFEDSRRGITTVKSEVWGPDAYDEEIKAEEKTKDAIWVVRQTYEFLPGGSRPVRQVNIYGALAPEGRGFTGNYSAVAVAAAPFPVPIAYSGTFRMIPIGPEPEPKGFLARLSDMFAGCGR
jgi:hypothetical protein